MEVVSLALSIAGLALTLILWLIDHWPRKGKGRHRRE